ncbi:hypothetical protein FRC11_012575 [Ceratobasidium sp. 423]|nr:hypothetical protein FRC11_012575 [Ceratobasidium sp. 423]
MASCRPPNAPAAQSSHTDQTPESNANRAPEPQRARSSSESPSKFTFGGFSRPGGYAPRPRPSPSSCTSLYRSASSPTLKRQGSALLSTSLGAGASLGQPSTESQAAPGVTPMFLPLPLFYSTTQTRPSTSQNSTTSWSVIQPPDLVVAPNPVHGVQPNTPPRGLVRRVASTSTLSSFVARPIFKDQSSQTPPSSLALAKNNYQRAEIILSNFHDRPLLTFAEFLQTIFSQEATTHLSHSSRQILSSWLRGRTAQGTRPAEILDLWYQHEYSIQYDNRQLRRASFASLTAPEMSPVYIRTHPNRSYFLHPAPEAPSRLQDEVQLYNAREGVEEWAVRATLHQIDHEAHNLTEVGGGLNQGAKVDWDTLKRFSVNEERRTIQRNAPVLWMAFQTTSLNRRTNDVKPSGSDSESGSDPSSDDSNVEHTDTRGKKRRSPSIAVTIAILMLLSFRNAAVNLFQTVIGVFLFACNAHKTVFRAFNRFGFSTAHSTVHRHLLRLGKSAQEALVDLAENAYLTAIDPSHSPQRYFLLIYDNINKYRVPRSASVAKQSHLASGTAATAVVMDHIPPGAFNPAPYLENVAWQERQNLHFSQLLSDIQHDHLRRVGIGMILRVLISHTPSLSHLSPGLERMFQTPVPQGYARYRLPVQKSTILNFGTSGINEATTKGNIDVTHDLVITQMKMKPEWFEDMLILVRGDFMTTDRLRKAKRYRVKDVDAYEQCQWIVPVTQLWHMKHAFLKVIFKVHWSDVTLDGLYGLRHGIEALGRKINTSECPFYACHDALKVVFDTLILTLFLNRIRDLYGAQLTDTMRTKINTNSHMLQELSTYFESGGPLHTADLSTLVNIAGYIYDNYLTTNAYEAATSSPDDIHPSQSRVDNLLQMALTQISSTDTHIPEVSVPHLEESSSNSSSSSSDDEIPHRKRSGKHSTLLSEVPIGDQALGTTILLLRDSFWYLEFATAVAEGDVGRVMEVIKVLRFAFWGGGARNYGNELLELACSQFYKYPPALQEALLNHYLVNPSGLPGHFHENDLLQEHHNRDTKTIFDSKQAGFDSSFMRNSVSINIVNLGKIKDRFLHRLGLNRTSRGKTKADYEADINVLAQHYRGETSSLIYHSGRQHRFRPPDIFGLGLQHLKSGGLAQFLKRTALNTGGDATIVHEIDPDTEDTQAQPIQTGAGQAAWELEVDQLTLDGHAGYLSLPGDGALV